MKFWSIFLWTLVLGSLAVGLFVDLDHDGARGASEYQSGGSLFVPDPASTRPDPLEGDSDLDSIPDNVERDASQWPPGLQPRSGTWRDLIVEVVVAVENERQAEIASLAMTRTQQALSDYGVSLTWSVTRLPLGHHLASLDSSELVNATTAYARYATAPYVRQWFIVNNATTADREVAGIALGHYTISEMYPYLFDCIRTGGTFDPPSICNQKLANRTASTIVHEVGHTLGLCHGHDPGCYERLPIEEQDGARQGVMSYESGSGEFGLTATQRATLRRGAACLGNDIETSTWESLSIPAAKALHITPCGYGPGSTARAALFEGVRVSFLWPWGLAVVVVALVLAGFLEG